MSDICKMLILSPNWACVKSLIQKHFAHMNNHLGLAAR